MIALTKITQAKWWLGDNPKSASNKWALDIIVSTVLYVSGLAIVSGTGMPNDVGMWLSCLWLGHFVTTCVWWRRLRKAQREAREAQNSS